MNEIILSIVREYKRKNRRDKARAFLEYISDKLMYENNSVRFYAECWNISKTTAHAWIKEFKDMLEGGI